MDLEFHCLPIESIRFPDTNSSNSVSAKCIRDFWVSLKQFIANSDTCRAELPLKTLGSPFAMKMILDAAPRPEDASQQGGERGTFALEQKILKRHYIHSPSASRTMM